MSLIRVLHCTVCLRHGAGPARPVLLQIGHSTLTQQVARLTTTCCWQSKLPITTQTQAAAAASKPKAPQDTRAWKETPSSDRSKNILKYCMMLSKFRLSSLVVMTSMAGYALAPAPFCPWTFSVCALGTGLVSAAANSVNQYYEVPFDAQMNRTKNRVLVKGLLEPYHAIGFASITATTGLSMLYFGVNPLTAALGATNLILYTSVYTPMKRISIANTWVGSVVGGIPPLMGWAGCAGTLDSGALLLGLILYSWQFPHFNALSWNLRPDYSKAGYRMMAVTNPGLCRRVALRHTVVITAACLAAPHVGVTNAWFALESLPLNLYFTYLAWEFYKKSDSSSSRKLFRFSLVHLPALMLLMLVNKKYWSSSDTQEQESSSDLKLADSLITVLPRPRGPVVAAQETNTAS